MNTFVISPKQSFHPAYQAAMQCELATGETTSLQDVENVRINHPEILKYKAKLLCGKDSYSCYADWVQFVIDEYGPREKCISLGSGLGRIEKYLVDNNFTKKIDTIELCANVNAGERINDPRLTFMQGDLNFIELPPNTYDFILCHGVLHHLINLEYVLDQINMALKPNGILLVYEYVGEDRWQFSKERMNFLKNHFPDTKFTIPPIWKVGGFESVRSGDLLPIIKHYFGATSDKSVLYGGVYFPFITSTPIKANKHLHKVIELDAKNTALPPCYHMGVYRKSPAKPMEAKKWSDYDVQKNLTSPVPTKEKFIRSLKQSSIGKKIKSIKKVVRKIV